MKFLKQVQAEMAKVVWPDKNTTALYTFVVIVISLFVAYYLSLFDFIFTNYGLNFLIN
ncbi:MAG: preprotein translocase subunit SecE [Candidatus Pacebacteria bacterium]|nr:preprotein translocase subunit SecE [Candidatus Paceibacterota bacterium]